MDVQQIVGMQIRMYRKMRGLSLEELAARIYKSKSIVSKYELGQANIDIATLNEIAQALKTDIKCLMDTPGQNKRSSASARFGIFTEQKLYLYIMERKSRKHMLHRGLLSLYDEKDNTCTATLYMGVEEFDKYTKCLNVYSGRLLCSPYNASMLAVDVQDDSEHICFFSTIHKSYKNILPGLYFAYTVFDTVPIATNMLLSRIPLEENDMLYEALIAKKENIRQLKSGNVYTASDFVEETLLVKK